MQRVYGVELISEAIWNMYSDSSDDHYDLLSLDEKEFWNMIGSEELECLVFLYLQSLGYYIFSSSLKLSTAKYEAVLIANDGSHLAYPQVKRNIALKVEDYIDCLENGNDKVYLFTTSENYGMQLHPQIVCITQNDLKRFMDENEKLLPPTIMFWRSMING